MIQQVIREFPYRFNKELASELGVSWRSLIRKARELGIEKESRFLDKNRQTITQMAVKAQPPHPHKGEKGWCVPNSEPHRFKKGNISPMVTDPEVVKKCHKSRNQTIYREKLRLRYGIRQATKLKLVNIY